MGCVADEVEEATAWYRRLRYRPGVAKIPPDVVQRYARQDIPKASLDKLQVRSDCAAEGIGAAWVVRL